MVAISVVWLYIYNPQYGLLNSVLGLVGIPPVRWINDPATALHPSRPLPSGACWVTARWVYLGGIQNISEDVLEAATIDGANAVQTVWHITIPLVSPTTFMLLILNSIEVLKMFTTINVMTDGGPAKSTEFGRDAV